MSTQLQDSPNTVITPANDTAAQAAAAAAAAAADKAAREAAVKKADAFFREDIKKDSPQGNPSDLFQKIGKQLGQEVIVREPEENTVVTTDEPKVKANLVDDEKKGGYIKSLKQTNEQLAREVAEAKKRLEEYETSKLPTLQGEIDELKKSLEEGGTKRELEAIRKELESAVKEKQEREDALLADVENLRKANAFLNLPADSVFRETYDAPIANGYNQVRIILGEDPTTVTEFTKGVAAYEASLRSPDQNERARQREISKQTFNSIYESLQPMEQARFNSTAYDVLAKVEQRQAALQNWEVTKAQADEERKRRQHMTQSQVGKRWHEAFDQSKKQMEAAFTYPEEVAKIIASQKFDDDTTEDELIAQAALSPSSQFAPEQVTRVLMQGAKFKKAKAYSFALERQISELNETIRTLRGSSTGDSGMSSSSSGKANLVEERTPDALFAKFRGR